MNTKDTFSREVDPSRTPTLKTIAFMTGYSVTAVSRALKDAPDIAEETKARIRMVANQIGYRPSRAGIRLRTGKTQVISLILDTDEEIMGLTNQLVGGITDRLEGTDFHLVLTPYSRRHSAMEPVEYITKTGAADGIILSRIEPVDQRIPYLIENEMAFVTHGRTDMGVEHAWCDYDNERFAFDAVKWLASKNAKRITLVGPNPSLTYARHMNAGFVRGINTFGLQTTTLSTETTSDDKIDRIAESISEIMQSPNRPDAFVCGSGSTAFATVAGAEAAGFRIGHDFNLVAKQSSDLLVRFRSEIHVIHEDVRKTAHTMADFLLRQMAGEDPSKQQELSYSE